MKNIYLGLLLLFPATASLGQSLTDSLVAHYHFNQNADDTTANAYHLTVTGATLTTDRNGVPNSAYRFDGSDYLYASGVSAKTFDEFSLGFWMKIDQMPGTNKTAGIVVLGGNIKDAGVSISNQYSGTHGLGGFTYFKTNSGAIFVVDEDLTDTSWHHVVVTCNDDSLWFYIDGERFGSVATGDKPGLTGTNPGLNIGRRPDNVTRFIGVVDDVRVYNRVLTPAEVTELHSPTNTGLEKYSSLISANVYPNPSSGKVTVEADFTIASLTVINTLGKEVQVSAVADGNRTTFVLPSGTYFIRLKDLEGNTVQRKVVIH